MIVNNIENKKYIKDFNYLKAIDVFSSFVFSKKTIFLQKKINNNVKKIKYFVSNTSDPVYVVNENIYLNSKNNNKYDFCNKEKKVFLSVSFSFYHFFMDTIASIIVFNNVNPGILFIIDFPDNKNKKENFYLSFLKNFLNDNKINYILIENNFDIKINNYYKILYMPKLDLTINEIYNYCKIYIKDKNKIPTKKVYLSRNNVLTNSKDVRVYEEKKLEDFFKNNGFEIIYDNSFTSIEDQINFFNDVKLLISSTSSGLLNFIFMQPKQKVLELITPVFAENAKSYQIHSSNYLSLCYAKKHFYFGVPSDIYSDKIIDCIKQNNNIYSLVVN